MRAKLINEKFSDKSDPVSDMDIGGFELNEEFRKIQNEAAEEWVKFLKDNLEGHVIKGQMSRWEDKDHSWHEFEIFVKKVKNSVDQHGFEREVTVIDANDYYYSISGEDKIYIVE